jgi:hypothetical protein
MNDRVKSAFKYSGVFILGLVVGAFLLESLEMYLRPIYRDTIIRSHLKAEQEFLASRAARANRPAEAAFHRWAVVNAESDKGFGFLRLRGDDLDGKPYTYPFALPVLKWMSSDEKIKKGAKVVEGLDRGKLAAALEGIGRKEEADEQWQLAQGLMQRPTIEATKETVQRLLKSESESMHKQAEDAVLGPEKK